MARSTITPRLRKQVRRRAAGSCEYCQYPESACYAAFHCDHCIPPLHGGKTDMDNLAWACPTCNGSKDRVAAVDPRSKRATPLFNPRRDSWDVHFDWRNNHLELVGRTPVGRATIALLRMNRPAARRIRALLLRLKLHPAQLRSKPPDAK